MSLLHRITRLFKADIHGILDAIEEPDIMLKQAVREMSEEIESSEAMIKTLTKELDRAAVKKRDATAALDELDDQIGLCIAESNEPLVKSLVRKKLETGQNLKLIEKRQQSLLEEKAALEQELAERKDKLKSIIDKLTLFTDRHDNDRNASFDATGESVGLNNVTQEDVELAFLKEKQKRGRQQSNQEQKQ